ncbi:hypothetical protein [Sphingomonas sp.]|jgi:hypothetical protein|uniref:hypothetical protein n=1 Tax=Sphingomonas sp. TaxID=28214 RepID=UPI002E3088FD|nr:hypothetical protein [Sphingomonas sp.]HEX4694952.1 hypothetical protein [Sphingomonas sp.]
MIRFALLASAALALGACSDKDGDNSGNGTAISISGNTSDGTASGTIKDGNLKIDAGGFKADLKIPKFTVDAKDFDLNGVHLYPGSTITSLNVENADDDDGNKNRGRVVVAFTSPASAATVREWLKPRLDKAGFKLAPDGNGLVGKTNDDADFTMKLADDGANKSQGTIDMGAVASDD